VFSLSHKKLSHDEFDEHTSALNALGEETNAASDAGDVDAVRVMLAECLPHELALLC
jgi:hypothetical protein